MIYMIVLLVIVLLTGVNALFAASEMALVSISPSTMYQLKQSNKRNVKLLEQVTKDSTKYLSTIQVAITFSGFLSSAFAGSELSVYLIDFFQSLNVELPNNIAVIIITLLLSFFTLVFGELVPKRVALSRSISIALTCAPIIYVAMKLFTPFVWLLTMSTRGVVRIFGIKQQDQADTITEKDIKEMIVYGHIEGLYNVEEKNMMERIFSFDDKTVDVIMTKKEDVIFLDIDKMSKELMDHVIDSGYSRVPVIKENSNNVIGVILIKDILDRIYHTRDLSVKIDDVLREPFKVDASMRINQLMYQMQKKKQHISFVYKKKELIGIVTFEDIVEEIVGEIYDEHDK